MNMATSFSGSSLTVKSTYVLLVVLLLALTLSTPYVNLTYYLTIYEEKAVKGFTISKKHTYTNGSVGPTPPSLDTNWSGWKYDENAHLPYAFSPDDAGQQSFEKRCTRLWTNSVQLDRECSPVPYGCAKNLESYQYYNNGRPIPKFNVGLFRQQMANKRILFMGCSLMRQQFRSLGLALGIDTNHENVDIPVSQDSPIPKSQCSFDHKCVHDGLANITICHQFLGSMAVRRDYNHTVTSIDGLNDTTVLTYLFDHHRRGNGDSSCILSQASLNFFATSFDVVIVQSVAWWGALPYKLDSSESPKAWLLDLIPTTVYRDAMKALLGYLAPKTKTVLTLGQVGVNCANATEPVPLEKYRQSLLNSDGEQYGWKDVIPNLWAESTSLIESEGLDVQIVDLREPLLSAVHSHYSNCSKDSHPNCRLDCVHFCLNSAALLTYLDYYQDQVF